MATTAHGQEVLTELCGHTLRGPVPAVLDDLSLSFALAARVSGVGRVRSGGMWVARLRRIGGTKLRSWGLLPSVVDDAELLISELVTNALQHGTGREVTCRLILCTDLLLIMVDDRSPGRPKVRDLTPDDEGGRGMFLVEALALAWGVSLDETSTWCALTTRAAGCSR